MEIKLPHYYEIIRNKKTKNIDTKRYNFHSLTTNTYLKTNVVYNLIIYVLSVLKKKH